jgi:hypothetical protein
MEMPTEVELAPFVPRAPERLALIFVFDDIPAMEKNLVSKLGCHLFTQIFVQVHDAHVEAIVDQIFDHRQTYSRRCFL